MESHTSGYAYAPALDANPASTVESLTARLNGLAAELESILGRLGATADRLFGEQPLGAGTNSARLEPVRGGRIGDLHGAVDNVERRIAAANDVASRFGGL